MIFSIASDRDETAARLLEFALRDASETVALAAAHALATSGRAQIAQQVLSGEAGSRAGRIAAAVSLLVTSL